MNGALILWCGEFSDDEVNSLHAGAFGHSGHSDAWNDIVATHSLGWVTARTDGRLVGFANVIGDGTVHAWIQDVIVDPELQRTGIGRAVVHRAATGAAEAGCEWLHVDFEDEHRRFYIDACGFTPTPAGLLDLSTISGDHD